MEDDEDLLQHVLDVDRADAEALEKHEEVVELSIEVSTQSVPVGLTGTPDRTKRK